MLPPGLARAARAAWPSCARGAAAGRATTRRRATRRGPADRGARRCRPASAQLERGPRPVRDLAGPEGRAGLLRRLRALEADGRSASMDAARGPAPGPRFERWIRLTDRRDGRPRQPSRRRRRPDGRPLGPRQLEALAELAAATAEGIPAAGLVGSSRRARRCRARPAGPRRGRGPRATATPAWPRARPAGAVVARPPASSRPPRPRPSSGSAPPSRRATRDRCCSTA